MPINVTGLSLKGFRGDVASSEDLPVPRVTIFVGPNNSGKSLALREIEGHCTGSEGPFKIISSVTIQNPTDVKEAEEKLRFFEITPPSGQRVPEGHILIMYPSFKPGRRSETQPVNIQHFINFVNRKSDKYIRSQLVRLYTARLDGRTRFGLVDEVDGGDLQNKYPDNHLQSLYVNDAARDEVRRYTEEAFGLHFVIDPTNLGKLRIRMAPKKPRNRSEEQSTSSVAREYHKRAHLISNLSDGIQCFTGLVAAVVSLPNEIILIDEPEAFLHPALARRLGQNLTKVAIERGASLFIATHSPEFIIGCTSVTQDVRLVRLTYQNDSGSSSSFGPDDIQGLLLDPLLRSAQALRGLFHRAVIVTEADRDRAFYEEINHRLVEEGGGVKDALFLNAQNWQTIVKITRPLRRLGIPAAAILDLDALANPDHDWEPIWRMLNLNHRKLQRLKRERQWLREHMETLCQRKRKKYKDDGVEAFLGDARKRVDRLISDLSREGVFLVPVGEVEGWLSHLTGRGSKRSWLERAFGALGSDTAEERYVRPQPGDVWEFMREVCRWVEAYGK